MYKISEKEWLEVTYKILKVQKVGRPMEYLVIQWKFCHYSQSLNLLVEPSHEFTFKWYMCIEQIIVVRTLRWGCLQFINWILCHMVIICERGVSPTIIRDSWFFSFVPSVIACWNLLFVWCYSFTNRLLTRRCGGTTFIRRCTPIQNTG